MSNYTTNSVRGQGQRPSFSQMAEIYFSH